MRKILISFHLVVILFFNSCNLQQNRDNGFVSRLHIPVMLTPCPGDTDPSQN